MKKNWLLAVSLALVITTVFLSGCTTARPFGIPLSQQQGIWVTGQGKVSVVPDIATLRLGIEAQKASVAEAQTEAAEAMDRVMATLIDSGVADYLGVSVDELKAAITAVRQEVREEALIRALDRAVEKERITQGEADGIKEWWGQRPEVPGSGLFQRALGGPALGGRHMWGGHRGWH